jgi:hypothetical protein
MNQPDQAWWERARRARDLLAARIMSDPNVRKISIGKDPERRSQAPVLIVAIRHGAAVPAAVLDEIDGIPVRVVYGDYRPEQGEPHDIREEIEDEGRRSPAQRPRPRDAERSSGGDGGSGGAA